MPGQERGGDGPCDNASSVRLDACSSSNIQALHSRIPSRLDLDGYHASVAGDVQDCPSRRTLGMWHDSHAESSTAGLHFVLKSRGSYLGMAKA